MMDVTKSKLYQEFCRLSLNSIKSVQSGQELSPLDLYLHVKRPVEDMLRHKMEEIDSAGSGIVLLVGSAGDGKSHLLSLVRTDFDWGDGAFYNDATASCSPNKTAVETLKEALIDFSDDKIDQSNRKLVLAINLGKLNAFIEDEDVRKKYSKIVSATVGIFNDDDSIEENETDKIKIVLFAKEQIFELESWGHGTHSSCSSFLSEILEKIVCGDEKNPFRNAYIEDLQNEDIRYNPISLNYELLQSAQIRETMVMMIIEAIVRFKLMITPREFLDFIYSIMVWKDLDNYNEKMDWYKALLPTLLFSGGDNLILKAMAKLDPILYSSTSHDRMLSDLFTSYSIPHDIESMMSDARISEGVVHIVKNRLQNNGRDIGVTTSFVFRIYHLLSYHSESEVYKSFMQILPKVLRKDEEVLSRLYETIGKVLPRHLGSFYEKPNVIPVGLQGGKYKLFTSLNYEPQMIESAYDPDRPTRFPLCFNLRWKVDSGYLILKMDYQLYDYILDLDHGRLVTAFDNEKSMIFSTFVRDLAESSNPSEVTIVKYDGKEKKLKKILGNVRLA